MAVTIILEVQAKKGTGNEILNLLKSVLPDTRIFSGCINVSTYQSIDNPDVIVLVENFESKEHYDKYLGWRQETGVFDSFVKDLDRPPSIRYFNLTDV